MLENIEYIKGVHCGDSDCYACGTQRYNCSKLDKLDKLEDEKNLSIDELEGSVRLHNTMYLAGIKTIAEARGLTFEQVKNMRNVGRKTWQELQIKLWGV